MAVDLKKRSAGSDRWSETELRIWSVGGWRFQLRSGKVHELGGSAAEEALARHLAVRHPYAAAAPELQEFLSRRRSDPIRRQSLHVAVNKLRARIAAAAGGGAAGKELAKKLLPHSTFATAPDGSRVATYGFDPSVWVDLRHAPDPLAFYPLEVDRDDSVLGGGSRSRVFTGFQPLAAEARARLEETRALTGGNLPPHLEEFTPPIGRLADRVPIALDRLRPGSRLVIQGKGGSGRLHLTEAIELGALAWCGRGAEQIREQSEADPLPPPRPGRPSPGHIYILDLTRELTPPQEDRLRAIRRQADELDGPDRPALLVVTDGSHLDEQGGLAGWDETETISLPTPDAEEVREAYLIATRKLPRDRERREAEFGALAARYAREHNSEIGLRAASSAASIAVAGERVPHARELPPPDAEPLPLERLKGEERKLAAALAWFGNDPFTLADAQAATGRLELPRSEIFRIATKIPGGGAGTYEVHPTLLDAKPAPEVPTRICEYLLEEENREARERWPLRAMRILSARSVDIELRLRLAPLLIGLARDLGFADDLQKKMRTLLERAGKPDHPATMKAAIGRARLLIHLGRLKAAEKVLEPITRGRSNREDRKLLRAEAHLRLAIVASQRGDRKVANKRAAKAAQLAPEKLGGRVERYYGWEALYTARFGAAPRKFEAALRKEQEPENRADATIGVALALLRLGRLKEAEGRLAELDLSELLRITRNRVVRAKATARFLRGDPGGGIEILDKALGQDELRASFQSADLLEARAYLHAKLGPDSLGAAAEDLKRSEDLLSTEDEWQKAVIHYLRALIDEERMRATPHGSEETRAKARESAAESVAAAQSNPWLRARAHTLLARLEVDEGGDRARLAQDLRAAAEAHAELKELWPDAMRETLQLGAAAAAAWQLREEQKRAEVSAAELAPRDVPLPFAIPDALKLLDRIACAVEAGERPEAPRGGPDANVTALGKLGEAVLRGGEEALARGRPLTLRLLQPRSTTALGAGIYDLDLADGSLAPTPGVPTDGTSILKGAAERRFVTQRMGAVLLAAIPENGTGPGDPVFLGQWLEVFRSEARKRGIATIESIAIEPRALKALDLRSPAGFVALGLVELPSLG